MLELLLVLLAFIFKPATSLCKMYAAEFKREEYDNVQEDENVKETKTKFQICHLETGLFLCESGEEKFHPSSDRRYTVTIRDQTETNWTEEKQSEKPGICFYKFVTLKMLSLA